LGERKRMEAILIISGILVCLLAKAIYDKKSIQRKIDFKIRNDYGAIPAKEYNNEKLEALKFYYNAHKNEYSIDDITWNDLEMDHIFGLINSCFSAYGEEYLYKILRSPEYDKEILEKRGKLIKHFSENKLLREAFARRFAWMGTMKNISVFEYMNSLKNATLEGAGRHIVQALALVGFIVMIFIQPQIGIPGTLIMLFANIITYFKAKSKVENYFVTIGFIVRSLNSAKLLLALEDDVCREELERLRDCLKSFRTMKLGAGLVSSSGMGGGDLSQLMLDYIRMTFHVDLIKFNLMYKSFLNHEKEFNEIFAIVGLFDSCIAIASFRELMGRNCEPSFEMETGHIEADGMFHPMVSNPVPCTFNITKSVLLTGSNASGKSTFLKTVAINQILAQTIYTVLAKSYKTSFYNVMSSMALRDDIIGQESYYIVEIKSLKRIIDRTGEKIPLFIFIDEVLRGTNTLERIAASSQILRSLSLSGSEVFAATHDIELTFILEKFYSNFHFEEHVEDNRVEFDYTLKEGRALTRNAIKLLSMLGYPDSIVDDATGMAADYLKDNEWKVF